MSHFSLLVVTKDNEQETLAAALQPFHEYECTGIEDQYVVDVDVTDSVLETWNEIVAAVRLPDGSLYSRYSNRFYHPTGTKDMFGRDETEFCLPVGAVETTAPRCEVEERPLAEWALEYGGWKPNSEGRFFDHTNPNKKWDFWQVGGRYSERLMLKTGNRVDSAQLGDLDLEAMRRSRCEGRRRSVLEVYMTITSRTGIKAVEITELWQQFLPLEEKLSKEWEEQGHPGRTGFEWMCERDAEFARLIEIGIAKIGTWGFDGANVPSTETDPLAWCDKAPALSSFAFLTLDGQWWEEGEMGWFAMVRNPKDEETAKNEWQSLFDAVAPEHYVTVVDCHI